MCWHGNKKADSGKSEQVCSGATLVYSECAIQYFDLAGMTV
jgi:hypothetical protein